MANEVTDSIVRSIVDSTLKLEQVKDGKTIVKQVSKAFRTLQKRRRELEPHDINLAAAEHYMYARFLAGYSGDPLVKTAPTLYGLKKRVYFALGIQDKMATTNQPVLPPSEAVEKWGTRGAVDGLADYVTATGKQADNYGKAISALASEAWRYN